MVTKSTIRNTATHRRLGAAVIAALASIAVAQSAQAQEILMSGPLAGAPAVRKLRLYREGRVELAPAVSFTLLDEYERTILAGAKLNYNITDWLAFGGWGAFGAVHMPTALTENIEKYHGQRACKTGTPNADTLDCSLTAYNLSQDVKLRDQVGQITWVGAPQLTLTPFRGKISAFESLYVDTDLHFYGGVAFVGLSERSDCKGGQCVNDHSRTSRTAITGTFGIGLTFYTHKWGGLGVDWRALPLSRNTGGFDTAGQGPNDAFPDMNITSKDREFKFNQMVTLSYSVFFPFEYRVSE